VADVVIRGGLVVDGTGAAPRVADIALTGDRITAVGEVLPNGALEIDASGRIVTPGFVDIHTHLDAQLFWDPAATSSCWQGVTTVVMGNCGVTFAPVRPEHHGYLAAMMESVEDIPASVIMDQLPWSWTTYGDYLDALDAADKGVNVGGMIGHCALRYYVMGERSLAEEPATARDIAQMQELVADAVDRGAAGFSTSRSFLHQVPDGRPIPGTYATADELLAIASVLGERGKGTIEVVPRLGERDGPNRENSRAEMAWMTEASIASGRPVTFALTQSSRRPDLYSWVLEAVNKARARGADLRPQTAPRGIGLLFSLASRTPYDHVPLWQQTLRGKTTLQRLAAIADRDVRRALAAAVEQAGVTSLFKRDPEVMYVMPPGDARYAFTADDSLSAHAGRLGMSPPEAFLQLSLEQDGQMILNYPVLNPSVKAVEELLTDPSVVLGLSDAGAHVGQSMDASNSTYFLAHWVRDRKLVSLAEGVRRLTSEGAQLFGLPDRGILQEGAVGDVNVIDYENLRIDPPVYVQDLPGVHAGRFVQTAKGFDHTIVNGRLTVSAGEHSGEFPGRVVRA
jgi:N-acyl-D-amino-acid deacylase